MENVKKKRKATWSLGRVIVRFAVCASFVSLVRLLPHPKLSEIKVQIAFQVLDSTVHCIH